MIDSKLVSRSVAPVLALGFALAPACSSPEPSRSDSPEKPAEQRVLAPVPWTDSFLQPAVLLAADVRIEGPVGLIRHCATVSNPEELQRVEKTIPEGFLQEIVVRPDAPGAEIRGQLDQLAIVATQRLTILERPGPVDVLVVANGDVYWVRGKEPEKRGASLRLEGKIAR